MTIHHTPYCPNFSTLAKKVWTVLSTEENVLLRLFLLSLPEMFSFVPSAITRPFFELQPPDFAWKFVWIVQINYKSTKVQKVQKKYKKVHKYKSTHNSVVFTATYSRFCMEVHMHRPTK